MINLLLQGFEEELEKQSGLKAGHIAPLIGGLAGAGAGALAGGKKNRIKGALAGGALGAAGGYGAGKASRLLKYKAAKKTKEFNTQNRGATKRYDESKKMLSNVDKAGKKTDKLISRAQTMLKNKAGNA